MSAHPGEDSTRGGTWSTGIDDAQQLVSRHSYAARMSKLLIEARNNQGGKIGVKELVEKSELPHVRPADLRPSSPLSVQAFMALGAAPEDLISRNRRAFAHLPPHLASIHEAHAAEERQRLITALLAKRAEFESHETKAPSRPHQKLAGDADVKEKNHRINATLEKKLAREVQDLQSREDRAVLAEAALEERRARAQERIESMRLRRGETKQQDLERSMKRHVEQMSQAATHAEGELQRTQTMEELAEMRRLEMDAQRRERAAERRSKWEQRRARALAKVRAASDMRIAELEVRERQLEERGQQRMRELGKSVAEKAREAEAQLEKAGERRKNFWADKTERTEKAHQEKIQREMEAEERISRHRNDRLTTVATFNNTRRWDPESVEARRQMWVQELESRKDRRDQQVKERVQRVTELVQERSTSKGLMSSCKLRSVELMERADEVRRAEQRREIEKKMEDFLSQKAEMERQLRKRRDANTRASMARWKKIAETEEEQQRLLRESNARRLAGVNLILPDTPY